MDNLLGKGILVAILVASWDKVKSFLKYISSFLVCYVDLKHYSFKYGAIYCWDKLDNKKSLSPEFIKVQYGSGENQRVLVREVGFNNFRWFRIGRIPILCKVNNTDGIATIIGLKPFINHEKILLATLEHYQRFYSNKEQMISKERGSRFCTVFKRGTLNETSNRSLVDRDECVSEAPDHVGGRPLSFDELESFDIGRRVNYTANEFKSLITFSKTKMIDNLYLTKNMSELKKKLEKWFNNKKWFIDRDIQWKRGVLVYGKPGTGKTSFIVSLAEDFGVPCFIFDLSTMTNTDLERAWESLKSHTPCFAVFEDFDSVFDGRENIYLKNGSVNGAKPASFDCVLNILDGARKYDGIVTFVTTNNVDKIDSAMGGGGNSRPGRIDYVYEMNGIGVDGKRFIAQKIFRDMEREEYLIEESLKQTKEGCTPAQFKELCINMALEEYVDKEDE